MSRQAEEVMKNREITATNEKNIRVFLDKIQQEVINKKELDHNTDLNGFIHRADILLNEPQFSNCKKMLFIISDGYQSKGGKNESALLNFSNSNFELCVCGWKPSITNNLSITKFESTVGFLQHLHN